MLRKRNLYKRATKKVPRLKQRNLKAVHQEMRFIYLGYESIG